MNHKHTHWLRAGLLVAILLVIALLPSAPVVTQGPQVQRELLVRLRCIWR